MLLKEYSLDIPGGVILTFLMDYRSNAHLVSGQPEGELVINFRNRYDPKTLVHDLTDSLLCMMEHTDPEYKKARICLARVRINEDIVDSTARDITNVRLLNGDNGI